MSSEIESGLTLPFGHSFLLLKKAFEEVAGLAAETETAMKTIVEKHNPSDRAERFVYGGAYEWVMAVAAWVAGIRSFPGGHSQDGFDLIEYKNGLQGLWSIKSSASEKPAGTIHLRNNVGSGDSDKKQNEYSHPTIFIGAFLPGIVYIDPKMAPLFASKFKYDKDAVKLKMSDVLEFAQLNPNCVIPFNAPKNQGTVTEDSNLKIVANILSSCTYPLLSQPMKQLQEISEQVKTLKTLNKSGKISDSQYEESIRKIEEDL